MRHRILTLSLGLTCLVALFAAGCRLVFVEPRAVAPAPGGEIIVQQPPPALLEEAPPPSPGPGHVWLPGHWHWEHGRHVWMQGRWEVPPRRAAVWAPARWERHEHGWRLIPGQWK